MQLFLMHLRARHEASAGPSDGASPPSSSSLPPPFGATIAALCAPSALSGHPMLAEVAVDGDGDSARDDALACVPALRRAVTARLSALREVHTRL